MGRSIGAVFSCQGTIFMRKTGDVDAVERGMRLLWSAFPAADVCNTAMRP